MRLAIELAIIVLLLGLNAVLSASELAIVSARKSKLRAQAELGNKAARRVLKVQESPTRFLAAVQVGITLAGFFASAVGAVSLVDRFGGVLNGVNVRFIASNSHAIALILITIVLSFVSIIVGELTPKSLAIRHAEAIALRVIHPIDTFSRFTAPVIHLLTACSNVLIKALGGKGHTSMPSMTKLELLALLSTAEDEGVVEEDEASLVEDAINFSAIQVRSVMVPRVDVSSIENTTTIREAVAIFFETGYSRLPVFRETPDNVLGILHIKDVFRVTWQDSEVAARSVVEILRPAFFVPETKQIDELLEELRARRTHIAVVVDEYGGMAGVVTLEDVLEELVGDISDEFDPGYEPVREIEPDVYDVDGRLSIHDLRDVLDMSLAELDPTDAESVGGLIADSLGRIPQAGDRVEHRPLILEVLAMDGYRVASVRATHVRLAVPTDVDGESGLIDEEEPTE
jgi:putative hemolysin